MDRPAPASLAPQQAAAESESWAELPWLLRPRWGAVAAYLTALLLSEVDFIQGASPGPILAAAGVTVITNLLLSRRKDRARLQALIPALLVFDVGMLTAVLFVEGGASNPLTALYLVPIALAAVMLPGRWAYVLAALTIGTFGLLFFAPSLPEAGTDAAPMGHAMPHAGDHATMDHGGHTPDQTGHAAHGAAGEGHDFGLHLRGMWIAFALTAISVAYFVTTVSRSLRRRERELVRARTRAMRAERVAALAGLAASTAHELGTPLASITLAASEMTHAIDRGGEAAALRDDAVLVQTQARRCRQILDTMLAEAGEVVGEGPSQTTAGSVVDDALGRLEAPERERVELRLRDSGRGLWVPPNLVAQAVHNLLRNAFEASTDAPGSRVILEVACDDAEFLDFTVTDAGRGMSPAEMDEALEPFGTTKTGAGHGMGLFFAATVAERLGGSLALQSEAGTGTRARLRIACDARRAG